MTSMIQQRGGYAEEIAKPLLTSEKEKDRYNSVLEDAISRIERAVASNPALQKESSAWLNRLHKQLHTNNYYVSRIKNHTPQFSLIYCVKMRDVAGLKFLLRTGEDPNQFERGKAALHWAATLGYKEMVEVLLQCPQLDKTIPTARGNTALELAKDYPEIQDLLRN